MRRLALALLALALAGCGSTSDEPASDRPATTDREEQPAGGGGYGDY